MSVHPLRGEQHHPPLCTAFSFSAASVGRKHDSIEVMKHILRDGGGLKAAETKHAGSRLAMQAGGWQSFNPHHSADKSACEFHFYPPHQFAWLLSDEQTPTRL